MSKTRESYIENYLNKMIKNIGGLSYKFTSVVNGVPDRIIIYNGKIYLVEVKKPNEKPRANQVHIHKKINEQNVPVYVIDTTEGVDDFVTKTLKAEIITNSTPTNKPVTFRSKSAFDI